MPPRDKRTAENCRQNRKCKYHLKAVNNAGDLSGRKGGVGSIYANAKEKEASTLSEEKEAKSLLSIGFRGPIPTA
jgi:hypothetical protein